MTFEQAKTLKAKLDGEVTAASDAFQAFPKGPMGMTPETVRITPEFHAAKGAFDKAFAALRAHNGMMNARFAKEMHQERRARRIG